MLSNQNYSAHPLKKIACSPTKQDVLFDNFRDDISTEVLSAFKQKGVTYDHLISFAKEVPTIYPWDDDYDKLRYNVNRRFVVYPWMIVMAETTDHVVAAIKWARKNNIPIVARSGSHCYEPYSLVDGMIIDQSRRTQMRVYDEHSEEGKHKVVVVESGALIGPVQEYLSYEGLALIGGTCPNVGIAGLTLGGGIGFLTRKYGLASDNLLAAEVVLANGDVIKCNSKQHEDLFWALRGAGNGNFGIVTKFAFRVHPIDKVVIFDLTYPYEQIKKVIDTWQRWAPFASDNLSTELNIFNDHILFTGQYLGPKHDLKKLLQPMLELDPKGFVKQVAFVDACRHFAGNGFYPPFFVCASSFAKRFLPKKVIAIIEKYMKNASPGVKLEINAFGGKMRKIPSDATAFVHRDDTLYWVQLQSHWSKQSDNYKEMAWAYEFFDLLRPYLQGAYVNCPESTLENALEEYYGQNLPRLIEIKQKYDPDNFFHYKQSIPIKSK